MDSDAVKIIIDGVNADYDIKDADDVTQLIIDILSTFNKTELEYALEQINILKENGNQRSVNNK